MDIVPASEPYAHLHESVRPLMYGPREARIEYLMQNQWLPHRHAREAIGRLELLFTPAGAPGAPSMFLCGPTGTGKSALLKQFCHGKPQETQPDGMPTCPALYIRMPPEPNETRLWSEILLALNVSHRYSNPPFSKAQQAGRVLKNLRCRMLVLDELHNLLHGPVTRRRQTSAAIKTFGEQLEMRIVVAGTLDALVAWHTDDEMRRRWPRYDYSPLELDGEFARLLRSYGRLLPIAKASSLAAEPIRSTVHKMSSGVIGEVAEVLRQAAVRAINDGSEEITLATLDALNYGRLYAEPA